MNRSSRHEQVKNWELSHDVVASCDGAGRQQMRADMAAGFELADLLALRGLAIGPWSRERPGLQMPTRDALVIIGVVAWLNEPVGEQLPSVSYLTALLLMMLPAGLYFTVVTAAQARLTNIYRLQTDHPAPEVQHWTDAFLEAARLKVIPTDDAEVF